MRALGRDMARAGEVKKLAGRTREATQKIQEMLTARAFQGQFQAKARLHDWKSRPEIGLLMQ